MQLLLPEHRVIDVQTRSDKKDSGLEVRVSGSRELAVSIAAGPVAASSAEPPLAIRIEPVALLAKSAHPSIHRGAIV